MGKKLNQIVAIEKDLKAQTYKDLTAVYHMLQKPELCGGLSKVYAPAEEKGTVYPPETKVVQQRVQESLAEVQKRLTPYFDLVFTKDAANQGASADVIVDGTSIIKDVPVSTLLFLEKQLTDLHTMLSKVPTLDPSEDWREDEARGLFVTEPTKTVRTKKEQRPLVLYPATDKHPAQTQLVVEDVIEGHWTTTKMSGAIRDSERKAMLARCEKLQQAVKEAREAANLIETTPMAMGDKLLGYLFNGE